MTDPDLVRFIEAQAPLRAAVTAELQAGWKRSHWMWFVFPQLAGLGSSPTAARYAIRDLGQARRYLADPVLGPRLRQDIRRMLGHAGQRSAHDILGSPDELKFRSSLTLFHAAAADPADRALAEEALSVFYGGVPDPLTLERLAGH